MINKYKLIIGGFLMILNMGSAFSQCTITGITNGKLVHSENGIDTMINGEAVVVHYVNVGQASTETFQIKVPLDTTIIYNGAPISANVTDAVLNGITNLDSSVTFACNPSNCTFPGNSTGCFTISATPTIADTGIYRAKLDITANVVVFGTVPYVSTILDSTFYFIVRDVVTEVGYEETADLINVYPNPFSDFLNIEFSNYASDSYTLNIYDMLGNLMRTENNITTNKVTLERGNLNKGIYFVELRSDNKSIKTKIILN